jgi:uncharacterized protein (DUF2141 family)
MAKAAKVGRRAPSALACLGMAVALAQVRAAEPCTTLQIDGVQPDAGPVQVAVYGSAATFRRRPLLATTLPAGATGTVRLPLCDVAADEVAVVVTQDVDADGRFDTNLLGIPTEPWGASGRRTLGPPSWQRARVARVPGGTLVVALR